MYLFPLSLLVFLALAIWDPFQPDARVWAQLELGGSPQQLSGAYCCYAGICHTIQPAWTIYLSCKCFSCTRQIYTLKVAIRSNSTWFGMTSYSLHRHECYCLVLASSICLPPCLASCLHPSVMCHGWKILFVCVGQYLPQLVSPLLCLVYLHWCRKTIHSKLLATDIHHEKSALT